MINDSVRHVVVVGGGTAGWITAGVLAAKCVKEQGRDLTITLIESPTIGNVGVGEGTWPSMRTTLQTMGISETDFIRECDASFKQGAKFARWVDGADTDFYYHPLMLPQGFGKINLAPYWQQHRYNGLAGQSFSAVVCFQPFHHF